MNPGEKNLRVEQQPDNSNPETPQTLAKYGSEQGAPSRPKDSSATLPNTFRTEKDTILRQKCATGVLQNSLQLTPELELIIRVWADLDDEVKQKILAIISKEVIP